MPLSLDLAALADALSRTLGSQARRFDADLLEHCPSTNTLLLQRAEAGAPSGSVLIARQQSAGRGRRGTQWLAATDDSLTFSLLWRFAPGTAPAGLSLAVGLACVRALQKVGGGETATWRLKWPNDVLQEGKKLAGILIELVPGAPHTAVIGIGLNLRLPAAMPADLRGHSAALHSTSPAGDNTDPNCLLALLLGELLAVLGRFAAGGFASLRDEWRSHHAFENAPIRLLSDFAPPRAGLCHGVDHDGALLFDGGTGVERILSGEISLRPV